MDPKGLLSPISCRASTCVQCENLSPLSNPTQIEFHQVQRRSAVGGLLPCYVPVSAGTNLRMPCLSQRPKASPKPLEPSKPTPSKPLPSFACRRRRKMLCSTGTDHALCSPVLSPKVLERMQEAHLFKFQDVPSQHKAAGRVARSASNANFQAWLHMSHMADLDAQWSLGRCEPTSHLPQSAPRFREGSQAQETTSQLTRIIKESKNRSRMTPWSCTPTRLPNDWKKMESSLRFRLDLRVSSSAWSKIAALQGLDQAIGF